MSESSEPPRPTAPFLHSPQALPDLRLRMESRGKVCPGPTPLHPPLQRCLMPLPPPHLDGRTGSVGAVAEGAGEGPEPPWGISPALPPGLLSPRARDFSTPHIPPLPPDPYSPCRGTNAPFQAPLTLGGLKTLLEGSGGCEWFLVTCSSRESSFSLEPHPCHDLSTYCKDKTLTPVCVCVCMFRRCGFKLYNLCIKGGCMHGRGEVPECGPGQNRLSPDGWGRGCRPDQEGHPTVPAPWMPCLPESQAPGVTPKLLHACRLSGKGLNGTHCLQRLIFPSSRGLTKPAL